MHKRTAVLFLCAWILWYHHYGVLAPDDKERWIRMGEYTTEAGCSQVKMESNLATWEMTKKLGVMTEAYECIPSDHNPRWSD